MNAPHRLALYLTQRSLLYFCHVVGQMPVDAVDIYAPAALIRDGRQTCPAFRQLADKGYHFLPVEQAGGHYGAVGVAGYADLAQHPALARLADRHIFLMHASTYLFLLGDDIPYSHVLCQFPHQINLGDIPVPAAVREIYPAGPYQLGEWEALRHLPKKLLRELLQKELGTSVPPDRELVLYCGGLHDHPQGQIDAVRQLAATRTVIFKPYYDNPLYDVLRDLPGVHLVRDTIHVSPNAMRFAADYIVTSPISGVFTTSLLLRLRVLPFLTCLQNSNQDRSCFAPWQQRMPQNSPRPDLHIARLLGGPFDNTTLQTMTDHMDNPEQRQLYEARQRAILPTFFGNYRIEGSAERAARGLLNVARCGSFGPEGEAEETGETA